MLMLSQNNLLIIQIIVILSFLMGLVYLDNLMNRDLDRYKIIKSVGRGQFSEVYKAIDTQTNEYVSIKHLRPIRKDKIKRYV